MVLKLSGNLTKTETFSDRGPVTVALRGLRGKLWLKRIVQHTVQGLIVGGGLAVLALIIARIIPIWYPWRWAFILTSVGFIVGLLIGLARRPRVIEVARFADHSGLQERMVTALSFQSVPSPMAVIQREEAVERFRREEEHLLGKVSVWRVPRWLAGCFALLILTGILLWFLPNPMLNIVKEQQQVKQALDQEEHKMKELETEIAHNEELTTQQKEAIQTQLQQLREALAESDDLQDGMQVLADTETELERLAEQAARERQSLEHLREQLASHAGVSDLAETSGVMDGAVLRELMQDTRDALEKLTAEERESLAQMLSHAADEQTDDNLAESLAQAANHLQMNDMTTAARALQNVVEAVQANEASVTAARNVARQTAQSLADSKQALVQAGQSGTSGNQTAQEDGSSQGQTGRTGNAGANGSPGTNHQRNGASQGHPSDGGAQGNGDGSGNGIGSGNGSGSGNGNGPGDGTGDGGGSGQGVGGSGAGLGSGSRELITVPSERLDGRGPEDTVGGTLGDGPETEQTHGTSLGSPGISRPYREVFGQYELAARKALQRSDLPAQYQQLVKNYFTDIEPVEEQ